MTEFDATAEQGPPLPSPDLTEGVTINAAPRRTRKSKSTAASKESTESLGKLAPVIIGMMQMAGQVVSDQAAMTPLEQTLIVTGLESLPSEQMDKALKVMGPISLVAGVGMYCVRIMTNRRPPPAPISREASPNPHVAPSGGNALHPTDTQHIPTGGIDGALSNPFISAIPVNLNGTSK